MVVGDDELLLPGIFDGDEGERAAVAEGQKTDKEELDDSESDRRQR